jgi:hypothetical protein
VRELSPRADNPEVSPRSSESLALHPAPSAPVAERVLAVFLLLSLPLAAHLAFSRFGFNPTDDGFVLAYSRRLLDGQVPHRDFLSIRPVGSALLHAPWVLLGGAHTFLLARLAVWFELGLTAWCWAELARRLTGRAERVADRLALAVVAFALTAGTFPTMPWHTVDAIALVSAGLVLASSERAGPKRAGYLLLGAAVLCRQNFLPVAPFAALLLGDRRRWSVGVWLALPLLAYAAFLLATGALAPAWAQLGSQAGLRETAIDPLFRNGWTAGGVAVGALAAWLRTRGDRGSAIAGRIAEAIGWAVVLAAARTLGRHDDAYLAGATFGLLGFTFGIALVRSLPPSGSIRASRLAWLAVLVAWCAMISFGVNSPMLAAGALAVASLTLLAPLGVIAVAPKVVTPQARIDARRAALASWTASWLRVLLACALLAVWGRARLEVIYRDRPARELVAPLDGVLQGGAGIFTNPDTRALLADLDRAVALTGGHPHAIVTDFAGYWVKARERNPLSIDWPQSVELGKPALQARVIAELEALRGHGFVIVQKYAAGPVAARFVPLVDRRYYFVPFYVREHFEKVGETVAFEIYR